MSTNSLGMILRMKHIKRNVKARRNGQKNISFVDFLQSIPADVMNVIRKNAKAADNFRDAYYELKDFHILQGCYLLVLAIVQNPKYVFDKITKNLLHIKWKK